MKDKDKSRSGLREPLVWLVFGIPAIAVVALVWMVFIAAGPGSTDSVDTTVKRTAQIQVADLGPDEAARACNWPRCCGSTARSWKYWRCMPASTPPRRSSWPCATRPARTSTTSC
jgi:hypothetical protein